MDEIITIHSMSILSCIEDSFSKTQFEPLAIPQALQPVIKNSELHINEDLLSLLSYEAFRRAAFYFRESHIQALANLLYAPDSSENDKFVVSTMLENAAIAAKGVLPSCQDTGTAIISAWKHENIKTNTDDKKHLDEGISKAYTTCNLRSSQIGVSSVYDEYDTGNNLPSQIHIEACAPSAEPEYRFLFVAKGGGSANKTFLYQMTKALLEEQKLKSFLAARLRELGVAACPPYHLAVVIGGTSAEENLSVLKLASTEILDTAPYFSSKISDRTELPKRDKHLEEFLLSEGKSCGLGAQFGGTAFLLSARVLRLSRHAASCPVSIAVSCSAHRNVLGRINAKGIWIEKLRTKYDEVSEITTASDSVVVNLNTGMPSILQQLSNLPPGTRLSLNGDLIVARDAAHLRWQATIDAGEELPEYLNQYPIYYAGPAGTPEGYPVGSLGPTTAQRMDPYAESLMSRGIALVTLAKGNRSPSWTEACKKYGAFYLGTSGGTAAILAEHHVSACEILDYPELGMEAVRKLTVKNLPAFIIVDNMGGELYQQH